VLTSDRGRGKTSALGIASARLISERERVILVTAPRPAAVRPLFLHARGLLPDAVVHNQRIEVRGSRLEFLPPDAIRLHHRKCDLLLVDEAAAIPAPLLEDMLRAYKRVVFATTVHGYEGTGRGFEIRFRRSLNRLTPDWKELRLEEPIRYAPDDPLEAFAARALLLAAEPAPASGVDSARPGACRCERLDRTALARDEQTLSQVFGLLVLAHYQTRPTDLRNLLDGPDVEVYVLTYRGAVVATSLVAIEGGFDVALGRQVFEGRRRPRGHLLPQTLSAHAGLMEATALRCARVVRIAVHPAARRRGLGGALLEGVVAHARDAGLDLVGASFGAADDLLDFWAGCGFDTVHVGTSRNAASGAHAAVVAKPLTAEGEQLCTRARLRLGERVILLLPGPLRTLEPGIVSRVLASAAAPGPEPDEPERQELAAFAFARRPYEATLPVVSRLLHARLGQARYRGVLETRERDALIAKALQHREWDEVAAMTGTSGRAQIIELMRGAVARLILETAVDRT
jgi:tRNA(Met) cytidine acetyltransferase